MGWDKFLRPALPVYGTCRRLPSERSPGMSRKVSIQEACGSLETRSLCAPGGPRSPYMDTLLVSGAREWDSIEYVRDAVLAGEKKRGSLYMRLGRVYKMCTRVFNFA